MSNPMEEHYKLMRWATVASSSVALILIITKTWAYWSTGSLSLLGSLLDSIMDGLVSIINFLAVRYALMPADDDHRFGHGKAESLAALGQSAFMVGSAVVLVLNSFDSLLDNRQVLNTELGIGVSIFAIVLTILLVIYQQYVVKKTGSLAIKADSLHYKGDLLLNFAVITALLFAGMGYSWLDQVFAFGIAAYLCFNAFNVGLLAWRDLMDKHLPNVEARVYAMVEKLDNSIGCHDVRSRQSGPNIFIQLHLELDQNMRLVEAHEIGSQLEQQLKKEYPTADVLIHHDPVHLQ